MKAIIPIFKRQGFLQSKMTSITYVSGILCVWRRATTIDSSSLGLPSNSKVSEVTLKTVSIKLSQ